jgi:hypothetical protein
LNIEFGCCNRSGGRTNCEESELSVQPLTSKPPRNTAAFAATQKYYYDPLNRVDDSTENINGTQTWRHAFSYNRYGNRNLVEAGTTIEPK